MDPVHDEVLYKGETKARQARVIMALAMLCPGLAYIYIGRLTRGTLVNALFVLLALGFVLAQIMWMFFPLLPGLIFTIGWLVLAWCVGRDACALAEHDASNGEEYLLKPYNHALPYIGIVALSFALPVVGALGGGLSRVWDVHVMQSWSMYPSLRPGDVVLIQRSGFHHALPKTGDIVTVSAGQEKSPKHILRVVASNKDLVRIEGDMLYLNKTAVSQTPVKLPITPPKGVDVLTLVEHNSLRTYPISMVRKSVSNVSIKESQIQKHKMFLMSDNRSRIALAGPALKIKDSRDFGPIPHTKLRGKPLFILWSFDADASPADLGRVGLRISP